MFQRADAACGDLRNNDDGEADEAERMREASISAGPYPKPIGMESMAVVPVKELLYVVVPDT